MAKDNIKRRCAEIANELQQYLRIKGVDSLIKKLKDDPSNGHLLHAQIALILNKSKKFQITHIERNEKINNHNIDVDIELNNNINIQVWYGQNLSQQITNCLANAKENNVGINGKIYKIKVRRGGIKTVCDEDSDISKKIDQLPNKNLGLVICHNLAMFISPEWVEQQLSENKAIVDIFYNLFDKEFSKIIGQSLIYCSESFKFINLTKEIFLEIGFPIINR